MWPLARLGPPSRKPSGGHGMSSVCRQRRGCSASDRRPLRVVVTQKGSITALRYLTCVCRDRHIDGVGYGVDNHRKFTAELAACGQNPATGQLSGRSLNTPGSWVVPA